MSFNAYLAIYFERERERDLLFHLFLHSLVDSCMCTDQVLNLQRWHMEIMLKSTELLVQGFNSSFNTLMS